MAKLVSATVTELAGAPGTKEVHFTDDVTVLYGLNGSGKTSLLKILDCAMTNNVENLLRVPFRTAQVVIVQDNETIVCTISKDEFLEKLSALSSMGLPAREMTLRQREMYRRLQKGNGGWKYYLDDGKPIGERFPAGGGESSQSIFPHRYLPTSRLTSVTERERSNAGYREVTEIEYDAIFASRIERIWEVYSRVELIQERQIQQEGLAGIFSSVLNGAESDELILHESTRDADAAYTSLLKFFAGQRIPVNAPKHRFLKRYKEDPLLRTVVSRITEVERLVADAHAPSRKIEQLIDSLYSGGKKLSLEKEITIIGSDSQEIAIDVLSSGEKQVLLILLECLMAKEDVIMIDEPELSMHVDWQNALIESMRTVNERAQIVLATHSPEVVAGVPADSIREL
ncbi:ATP-binding protein [Nocardia sp. NPDC005746]|uniref:ATP-binding protein n=1 Tax=Nocardia sp. NPDC005746 TaxID=3157062 RepID=UPI00340EB252